MIHNIIFTFNLSIRYCCWTFPTNRPIDLFLLAFDHWELSAYEPFREGLFHADEPKLLGPKLNINRISCTICLCGPIRSTLDMPKLCETNKENVKLVKHVWRKMGVQFLDQFFGFEPLLFARSQIYETAIVKR